MPFRRVEEKTQLLNCEIPNIFSENGHPQLSPQDNSIS